MSPDQAVFFAREAPFFQAFAQQFSLDPKVIYLMAGQKGSIPNSVRQRYRDGRGIQDVDIAGFDRWHGPDLGSDRQQQRH